MAISRLASSGLMYSRLRRSSLGRQARHLAAQGALRRPDPRPAAPIAAPGFGPRWRPQSATQGDPAGAMLVASPVPAGTIVEVERCRQTIPPPQPWPTSEHGSDAGRSR